MNPEPRLNDDVPPKQAVKPSKRRPVPGLFGCLFAALAVFVLGVLILPCSGGVQVKGAQTKALAQARQIALALKLFASDNDGNYPRLGIPALMGRNPEDSNAAFACLFPTYTQCETIFANKLSAYQTTTPDNVIDVPYTGTPRETLQPGENVYSYVMGLTDADDPKTPLIADGTDGTGHYRRTPAMRGGVWKGEKAVVIRLDDSGAVETLTGPDAARFVPARASSTANLLDFSRFGKEVRLLDPAAGPGGSKNLSLRPSMIPGERRVPGSGRTRRPCVGQP